MIAYRHGISLLVFKSTSHLFAALTRELSGTLKKITLTTLFYGISFHQDRPLTAQTKDTTSASKKNYSSFAEMNYYYSINVMNSCPHAATETKRYCVTIAVLIITKQAWRDESIVSLFFPVSQHISRSTPTNRALENGKIDTQTSYI